jgi:hypothetical protein
MVDVCDDEVEPLGYMLTGSLNVYMYVCGWENKNFYKLDAVISCEQWRTEGGRGWGVQTPPEIPKLGQILRSVENKSVTT